MLILIKAVFGDNNPVLPTKLKCTNIKVTADIHLLHASSYQLLIGVFSLANMWKASWGFSSYWITLGIIEAIKLTFVLFISVANVSACLQAAVMLNFR